VGVPAVLGERDLIAAQEALTAVDDFGAAADVDSFRGEREPAAPASTIAHDQLQRRHKLSGNSFDNRGQIDAFELEVVLGPGPSGWPGSPVANANVERSERAGRLEPFGDARAQTVGTTDDSGELRLRFGRRRQQLESQSVERKDPPAP